MSWKRGSDHRNDTDDENFDEEELLGDEAFSGAEEGYIDEDDGHSSLLDEEDEGTNLVYSQQQFHSQAHADTEEHGSDSVNVNDEDLLEDEDAEESGSGLDTGDSTGMLDTQVSEDEYADFPEPINEGERQPCPAGPEASAGRQQGNTTPTEFQTKACGGREQTRTWRPKNNNTSRFGYRRGNSSHFGNQRWPRFQANIPNNAGWMPANAPFRPPLPLMSQIIAPPQVNSQLRLPQRMPVAGNGPMPTRLLGPPPLPPLFHPSRFPSNQNFINNPQNQTSNSGPAFQQGNRLRFAGPHQGGPIQQRLRPRKNIHRPQRHRGPRGRAIKRPADQWRPRNPQPDIQEPADEPASSRMEIEYNHGLNKRKKPESLNEDDNSTKKKALLPSPDLQYEQQLAHQAEERDRIRREKEKRRIALARSAAEKIKAANTSHSPQQANDHSSVATAMVKPQPSYENHEQYVNKATSLDSMPTHSSIPSITHSVSNASQMSTKQTSVPRRGSSQETQMHNMHQAPVVNDQKAITGQQQAAAPSMQIQSSTGPQQHVGQSKFSLEQPAVDNLYRMQQPGFAGQQAAWHPEKPLVQNYQNMHQGGGQSNTYGHMASAPTSHPRIPASSLMTFAGQPVMSNRHIFPTGQQKAPTSQHMPSANQRMPPASQHMPPVNQHMPPVSQHMPPVSQHMPPANQRMPPANQHMPPASQHMPPANQHMPPANQHMPPAGQHMPPASQHMPPASQHMPPAGQHMPPAGQHVPPANQHVPPASQHMPPAGQHMPPASQHVPSANQRVPPANQHVPPASQHMPPAGQHMPPAGQHVPSADQHVPPADQHVPPANQHMPPAGQHMPPASQYMSPVGQHMPPANQHMPPANQHMPPAKQQMPPAGYYMTPVSQPMTTAGGTPLQQQQQVFQAVAPNGMQYALLPQHMNNQGQPPHSVLYAQAPSATYQPPQDTQKPTNFQQQSVKSQLTKADTMHNSEAQNSQNIPKHQSSRNTQMSRQITSSIHRKRVALPKQTIPAKSSKLQYRVHPLDMLSNEAQAAQISLKAMTREGDEEYDQDDSQAIHTEVSINALPMTAHVNPRHLKKVKGLVLPELSTKPTTSAKCSNLSERFKRHHAEKKTELARLGKSVRKVKQNSSAEQTLTSDSQDQFSESVLRRDNSVENLVHVVGKRMSSESLELSRRASSEKISVVQRSPAVQQIPSAQGVKKHLPGTFRRTIKQVVASGSSSSCSEQSQSSMASNKAKLLDRRCCKVLGFDRSWPVAIIRDMGNEVGVVDRVGRLKKNPEIVVITFSDETHALAFRRRFDQSEVMGKRIRVEFVKGSKQR